MSEYIRRKYSDDNGICECVTCGKKAHWKEQQAGHFVPGRTNSVLFVEENIHPQCPSCNVFKHGNLIEYYPFMISMYGQEKVDELRLLKHKAVKITDKELEQLIEELKGKIDGLSRES